MNSCFRAKANLRLVPVFDDKLSWAIIFLFINVQVWSAIKWERAFALKSKIREIPGVFFDRALNNNSFCPAVLTTKTRV